MTEETLIFKDKKITEDDLEIIFHKDFTYIYNETEFPIVYYKLTKCKHLDKVDFENMDYYNNFEKVSDRVVTKAISCCIHKIFNANYALSFLKCFRKVEIKSTNTARTKTHINTKVYIAAAIYAYTHTTTIR